MVWFSWKWLLTMVLILSISMMVGGIAKNTKTASVIVCILYFPILIFFRATLPFEVMSDFIQKVISIFHMTQGIQLMKVAFLGLVIQNVSLLVIIMGIITIICMLNLCSYR